MTKLTDVEADHFPAARLVDALGEHKALANDAAAIPHFLDLGIQEEVGVGALERTLTEGLDLLVEALADPRDLTLGDAQAECLHHLIDLAR